MFTQQTQIPRSPLASTLTLVFHVGLGLAVIGLMALPSIPRVHQTESLVYIPAAALPDLRFEVPPSPPPTPAPRLEAPRPEPPKALAAPVIERPAPAAPTPAPLPPPVATPERRVPEPPREVPPPVKPAVTVGAFADAATAVRKERVAEVIPGGFDGAAAAAARTRREVQAVDGFASSAQGAAATRATVSEAGFGAWPASPTQARGAVTTGVAGFSSEPAARPAAGAPRSTASAGFASETAPRPAPVAPKAGAQTAGFATAPAPVVRPVQAPPPPRADRQVEIVFKPSPGYTPEARAQRIEGEVTLEVEFTASGAVRVLRVVRGLGYGLDEMAQRAAEQIRFKPATSQGTPVDVRVNLTILFRLT